MAVAPLSFERIQLQLLDVGFPASGAVDYELALADYQVHAERYRDWVKQGSHGEMRYLERGLDRRLNPTLVFPGLKSVIAVLLPYSAAPLGNDHVRYARYLRGKDYHLDMRERLEQALGKFKLDVPGFDYKICVDTSAVLERAWAYLCGLGWIGKNTLLIHPQLGSYSFIGVVFTNQVFGLSPKILKDYCGHCTRCMTTCPTEALPKARYLESRKCISYLTLEKRGPWEQSFDSKGFIAGCDLCQEVCPFNLKAAQKAVLPPDFEFEMDIEKLLNETETEYLARVRESALSRIKFADFKRNVNAIPNLPGTPRTPQG